MVLRRPRVTRGVSCVDHITDIPGTWVRQVMTTVELSLAEAMSAVSLKLLQMTTVASSIRLQLNSLFILFKLLTVVGPTIFESDRHHLNIYHKRH